jgi:hypothetical protein
LSQVNSQTSGQLFPVVVGLPCKSYPVMLQVAQAAGQTYIGAIAGTQRSLQELETEDFSRTISNIQSPFLLSTLQGVGQAVMADVQERRYERQQLGMLTVVEATHHLQEIDAVTRAKLQRQGDGC